MSDDNRRIVYQELCNSYREIDDFRAKLLAFLPFASATGLFLLLNDNIPDPSVIDAAKPFLFPIGIFGFVVTLGLFSYEIYGINKCGELINTGINLESDLKVVGQFRTRPNYYINEPFAAGVIYPAVLAAWFYLVLYTLNICAALLISSILFFFGFACMLVWDIYLVQKARERQENRTSAVTQEG